MDIIQSVKVDLEKILGFPIEITLSNKNSGKKEPVRIYDLDYINNYDRTMVFRVARANKDAPCAENNWNNGWVSQFTLQQMPGCCGVLLSTKSSVAPSFQKKGVATRLNQFRQEIAYHQGYATMICTDVAINDSQSRVLEKRGWQRVFQFLNWRTQNKVNITVCEIPKNPDEAKYSS